MGLVSVELPCLTGFCPVVTICFAAGGDECKIIFLRKKAKCEKYLFFKAVFSTSAPKSKKYFYIQYMLFRGKNVDVWKPMTVHLALRSALCL